MEHSELLVAVTANDEANLVASMVGKSMGVKQTICRIEASGLAALQRLGP